MKKLIILILILLVLGLYFFTDTTKEVISLAGSHSMDLGEKAFDKASEKLEDSDKVEEMKEKINDALS